MKLLRKEQVTNQITQLITTSVFQLVNYALLISFLSRFFSFQNDFIHIQCIIMSTEIVSLNN